MPKDRSKYRYFDVGLERNSWALVKLEEDARKHHMSDQPGKLIALRLTEYYEQKELETLLTRNGYQSSASVPHTGEQERRRDTSELARQDIIDMSQSASENADEAADYWATL